MYNRLAELSELQEKIASFEFTGDLMKYKDLIEGKVFKFNRPNFFPAQLLVNFKPMQKLS